MSLESSDNRADLRKRSSVILRSSEPGSELMPSQADNDDQLIELWLHGRPATTQRAYRADIVKLRQHVDKPLQIVTLGDLQSFIDSLTVKPSSTRRTANAIKSLMAFGFKLGYLRFDVGRALRVQTSRDELAERILSETEVLRILASENNPRNRAILLTFYGGGFRVSEIASLKWRHLQERDSSGQITVYGKGGKTRSVLVPVEVWKALIQLRGSQPDDAPVFKSRKRGHLVESAIWRIVKKAAKKAGLSEKVSCHSFRHAHASHALDSGAPIHLVQTTLGHASIATTGKYLHARPSDSSGNYLPAIG